MLSSLFPWILYLLACISTFYTVQQQATSSFWPTFLLFVVFFNGGIQGLWAAMGHLLFSKQMAKKIGWEMSAFQREVGVANLGIGVTGILTYFNPDWAIPVGLILAIFLFGCAYGHVKERFIKKNKAPYSGGLFLSNTIVVALSIFLSVAAIWGAFCA